MSGPILINKIRESYLKGNFLPGGTHQASQVTTFLNPFSYLVARKNIDKFRCFDSIFVDGALLVFFFRIFGFVNVYRVSFDMTSMAPKVFMDCIQNQYKICFVGGKIGVSETASNIIGSTYTNLKITDTMHGFFDDDYDRKKTIKFIVTSNPEVVICGMGSPNQEKFLIELANEGWNGSGYTCGGFFHQTSKKGIQYYPTWCDKYNLRWMYRMYDEPKLIKRYAWHYPIFIFIFIFDMIVYKIGSDK